MDVCGVDSQDNVLFSMILFPYESMVLWALVLNSSQSQGRDGMASIKRSEEVVWVGRKRGERGRELGEEVNDS